MESQDIKIIESQYEIIRMLGRGTFGKVLLAHDHESGQSVALKLVRKDKTQKETFLKELYVSVYLSNHEGIIFTYPTFLDTADHFIIIQELAVAGTLHSIMEFGVGVPEETVKRCAVQLLSALHYIHSMGFVHRDVKPDNVLLMDKDCTHVKLGDFGFTQCIGSLVPAMSHNIPYMAPELCSLQQDECLIVSPSVDIFALGVLLYMVLTGYFPWEEATENDHYFNMFVNWQTSDCVFPPINWEGFTMEAMAMFSNLLSPDPSLRPSTEQILKYLHFPWCVKNIFGNSEVKHEEIKVVTIQESQDYDVIIIPSQDDVIIVESMDMKDHVFVGNTADDQFLVLMTESTGWTFGTEAETYEYCG